MSFYTTEPLHDVKLIQGDPEGLTENVHLIYSLTENRTLFYFGLGTDIYSFDSTQGHFDLGLFISSFSTKIESFLMLWEMDLISSYDELLHPISLSLIGLEVLIIIWYLEAEGKYREWWIIITETKEYTFIRLLFLSRSIVTTYVIHSITFTLWILTDRLSFTRYSVTTINNHHHDHVVWHKNFHLFFIVKKIYKYM